MVELEASEDFRHIEVRWPDAPVAAGMTLRVAGDELADVTSWATPRFFAIAAARQVHGNRVERIDRAPPESAGAPPVRVDVDACDGFVTASPGVLLTVKTADCVPVLLYERGQRALALLHAGWRGVAAEILPAALRSLEVEWEADPARVRVYLGPAVGACCYPVGSEVIDAISATGAGAASGWRQDGHVDLRAALATQAIAGGVSRDSVTVSSHCTSCDPDRFHSYRRDGPTGGRMVFFAGIPRESRQGGCGGRRRT